MSWTYRIKMQTCRPVILFNASNLQNCRLPQCKSREWNYNGVAKNDRDYPKMLKLWIFGIPKTIKFPFVPNGKFMVLGVQIFKHAL